MGTDDHAARRTSLGADPDLHAAVIGAMYGDSSRMVRLDDARLQFAARSLSIMVAGRVLQTCPCDLAGFTFYPDTGALTFVDNGDSPVDPVTVTAARMVAVDGTALVNRDVGPLTHDYWLALWSSVPSRNRSRLAFTLIHRFTAQPRRVDHNLGGTSEPA